MPNLKIKIRGVGKLVDIGKSGPPTRKHQPENTQKKIRRISLAWERDEYQNWCVLSKRNSKIAFGSGNLAGWSWKQISRALN